MQVIPAEYNEVGGGSNVYLKGEHFATDAGLTLKVVSFEKKLANNAAFGAQENDTLVKRKVLKEGEVFVYNFKEIANNDFGMDGSDKIFTSKSAVFFFSFRDAKPEVGDILQIKRVGSGKNTKYFISKIK